MTKTDQSIKHDRDAQFQTSGGRGNDDRRRAVDPTDRPVPTSPEPEEDAVKNGQEKLDRVKPY
jgi:hypothetical protein